MLHLEIEDRDQRLVVSDVEHAWKLAWGGGRGNWGEWGGELGGGVRGLCEHVRVTRVVSLGELENDLQR